MKGDEARPVFAFGGIWRSWRGELKGEFVELEVMAIMTTTPNDLVKPIHPTRMPVIVHADDHETWLTGDPKTALKLARPYPADAMRIVHTGETKDEAA